MAFNAEQRKISTILSGDWQYTIPRYQRKYVWEEKQWRELLDDLKYCLENENISSVQDWTHFLGSFVFEKNQKDNKLVVIDGQQRLTTIIIMLCAICVLFNEAGEQDRFNGVTKYILGTDDLGKPYSRVGNADLSNFQLLVDEATSYNSLQSKSSLFSGTYLVSTPKDNLNIKQCFNFFYTQFSEMIDSAEQRIIELSRIKDKILALDVIEILATNQQESYNIFEILNARGVDLQQHELIKNYILKYVQPRSDIDRAKIQWDKLEDLLFVDKRPVITTFFNHYVTHRYEKPTKDNSEFRIIKAKCSKNEMSELLEDLIQKAKIYRWFYLPGECNNSVIRQALQFFKDNNHRQFRPIFLSVISALNQEKIDITMAEKFFLFLQNFYFAYGVICGGKSNALDDTVTDYAKKIETEDAKAGIIDFIKKLRTYYPPYSQFLTAFKLVGYSQKVKSYKTPAKKHDVQYILRALENYWQAKNNELSVQTFTIEHIGCDNGEESHCRIGNLLPLAAGVNNSIGDDLFVDKISQYKKSNFVSVKKFVERYGSKTEWTEQDIDARATHMAELAYNIIWSILGIFSEVD